MDVCRLGNNSVVLLNTATRVPVNEEVVINGMTLFVGREDDSPTVEVYLNKSELAKLQDFLNNTLGK
jgi:hypothetical protein